MNRRWAILWVLLAALVFTPAVVQAQNFSETRRGDGSIERGAGDGDTLREASVNLRSNGELSIVFQGRRSRHSFGGKWTRGRSNQIDIRVDGDFGGSRATGTGEIYLRGRGRDEFERITINGTENGRRFYIRFEAGDSGRPSDGGRPTIPGDLNGGGDYNGNDRDGVRSTQSGRGSLRTSGRRAETINRVRVEIDGDKARVITYGSSTQTFGGRVTKRDGENIQIRVDGDVSGEKVTLEGFVNVRRSGSGFDRIRLNSRKGPSTSIDFDAR